MIFSKSKLAVIVALAAMIMLSACSGQNAQASRILNLTILHTNNLEGALNPCSCVSDPAGGAARRATAVKNQRSQSPELFLVDAGDALFGTPESDDSLGFAQVDAMNVMKYDAAALGDKDFEYGLKALQDTAAEAKFPFLSANIVKAGTEEPFFQASVIVEREGYKVAFLGLTTIDVQKIFDADADMSQSLAVLDPLQTAKKLVPQLRKQADAVVVLSHLGSKLDRQLFSSVPGIAAIVGGHSRELITPTDANALAPIVQLGYQGDQLGVLKLEVNGKGEVVQSNETTVKLGSDIESDPEVQEVLMPYKARAALKNVIDFSAGLSPLLPLEIHRADPQIQRAYLGALAYPERFQEMPFPGKEGAAVENLFACFIKPDKTSDGMTDFSLLAISEPACVEQANQLLDSLPKPVQPTRVVIP